MALRLYGNGNIENVTSINNSVSSTELEHLSGISGIGKVLQVVSYTSSTQWSTTSTSIVDTDFSLSITPLASTSKVLLMFNTGTVLDGGDKGSYNALDSHFAINRDSTNITGFIRIGDYFSTYADHHTQRWNLSYQMIDEPATTSAINYKVTCYTGSSITFIMNYNNKLGSLIAMEIAA